MEVQGHQIDVWFGFSLTERLEGDLNHLQRFTETSIGNLPSIIQDSSPDTPQPNAYDLKQGWMNGIFGCLRPVLSIIGKGVQDNKNGQGKYLLVKYVMWRIRVDFCT